MSKDKGPVSTNDDEEPVDSALSTEADDGTPPAERKKQSLAAWHFAQMAKGTARYNHSDRKWYLWRGHYWREDPGGGITRLWQEVLHKRYADALKQPESIRQPLLNDIIAAGSTDAAVAAGIRLATAEPNLSTNEEQWDTDPYLLACENGVVDLRTGVLRDGQPTDLISRSTKVKFLKDAKCDRWNKFLTEVFPDDADLQEWYRQYLGAGLVGTKKEMMAVNHGKRANNGKSKLVFAVMKATGDYAITMAVETLMNAERKAGGTTNDLMRLRGARLVFTNEPDRTSRLKGGVLKRMVSVDKLTGRPNYGPEVEWVPSHSIILSTNTLPTIDDADNGVWDRLSIVPWNVRFHEPGEVVEDDDEKGPDAENADQLEAALAAEAPGILAQLVRYAVAYNRKPTLTKRPKVVNEATAIYRVQQDLLAPFIADRLIYEKGAEMRLAELQASYVDWCEKEDTPKREQLGPRRLGPAMLERGHGVDQYTHWSKHAYLTGVRLRQPTDPAPSPAPSPSPSSAPAKDAPAEPGVESFHAETRSGTESTESVRPLFKTPLRRDRYRKVLKSSSVDSVDSVENTNGTVDHPPEDDPQPTPEWYEDPEPEEVR